jgi:RNA polymerase sigma-70 factor (ECF subfamily)
MALANLSAVDPFGALEQCAGAMPDDRSDDAAERSGKSIDPQALMQYRPQLLKHARWMLRDSAAAEDAVQETLLAALQPASSFSGRSSVRTWLFGILRHKLADAFRRQARELPLEEETVDELYQEDGHLQRAPAEWSNPEAALTQQRFFEVLERCVAKLPPNMARVFTMRDVMGMETAQICEALGITQNNCFVMLCRARMALRGLLEEHWFGHAPARS